MSQENVEIVRAAYRAWNAGDMDAFGEFYDPDVIVRPPSMWPEPGPFVGREEVMRFFEQTRDVWDTDTLQPTATSSTPLTELSSGTPGVAQAAALSRSWR